MLEGLVDVEQAAVAAAGEGDDVGAVVEDGGELLFGEAQGFFGVLGFGDVDHEAADDRNVAVGMRVTMSRIQRMRPSAASMR